MRPPERYAPRRHRAAPLTPMPAVALPAGGGTHGNQSYLDALAAELAAWNGRLARLSAQPRLKTRSGRLERRKSALVARIRHRNLERRIADMRASPVQFESLRPGLLLLWRLFTSGIEKAET